MPVGVKAVLLRCCIFAEGQYLMYYLIRPRRFGRLLGALCIFSLGCENIQRSPSGGAVFMPVGVKAVLLRCCIFAEDQYLMYYLIRPRRFGRLLGALCIFSLGCENIQRSPSGGRCFYACRC